MDREKLFEEFLRTCRHNEQICGLGNPCANILIIGQEPYISEEFEANDVEKYKDYLEKNYTSCRNNGVYNIRDNNKTWSNYQLLIEKVYKEEYQNNKHDATKYDFEEFAYTSELSSWPRKKHSYIKAKPFINKRLILFKDSDYIKSFPVIILACGCYIKNDDKLREIDNTFHVEFCKEYGSKQSKNRFWTHVDKSDPRKLVIHTRQFSNGISNDLIKEMANVIRNHLTKLGLI